MVKMKMEWTRSRWQRKQSMFDPKQTPSKSPSPLFPSSPPLPSFSSLFLLLVLVLIRFLLIFLHIFVFLLVSLDAVEKVSMEALVAELGLDALAVGCENICASFLS